MEPSARQRFVRPRVRPPDPHTSGALLLEDLLTELLESGERRIVLLHGRPGSGRRSALEFLRQRFAGEERLLLCAEPPSVPVVPRPGEVCLLLAGGQMAPAQREYVSTVLELAPWSRDECIEYLLARHPQRCASVMQRLERAEAPVDLEGVPLIVSAALEALAADESLCGEFEALRTALKAAFGTPELLARARAIAFQSIPGSEGRTLLDLEELLPWANWLRQTPVLLVLAAEAITILLEQGNGTELPTCAPDEELLRAARPLLESSPAARAEAARMLECGPGPSQPWAASLLHLAGPDALAKAWPKRSPPPRLDGAHLAGMQAAELDLSRLVAPGIRLRGADLDRSDWSDACIARGEFARASLRAARMRRVDAKEADFSDADLEGADAQEARFDGACLERANLSWAVLTGASLSGCTLLGARAVGADVSGANLSRLDLRGLQGLPARFVRTMLAHANLEGQSAEAPDFQAADLPHALLSATRFPRGDFRGAVLREARLAWIDWEGANLFGADLSGASFHLGSSRSGLVFDAPAGWGTRTGFYTDEMRDLGFKLPEEVRRANLRGADLRKANVFETDFHLVDVRGALFTPDQEKHLRSCGAILGN